MSTRFLRIVRPVGAAADIGHPGQCPQQIERLDLDVGSTARHRAVDQQRDRVPHQRGRAGIELQPGRREVAQQLGHAPLGRRDSRRTAAATGAAPPAVLRSCRQPPGGLGQLPRLVAIDLLDQGVAGREMPIERADAHAGVTGDLLQGDRGALGPRKPAWPRREAGGGCAPHRRAACAASHRDRRTASASLDNRRCPPYINRRRSPFMTWSAPPQAMSRWRPE